MKKTIKKIIIYFLYYSGISNFVGIFKSNRLYCIGYHSISDAKNLEELSGKLYSHISIDSKIFSDQLNYLKKRGHTFIHFSDLKNIDFSRIKKPTILYFDDGYKDNILNALPIIKENGATATVFITTGLVDRTHFLWTLAVKKCLLDKGNDEQSINHIIKKLKKSPKGEREKEINKIFLESGFEEDYNKFNVFLDWNDIKQLILSGVEIGSHGISHNKLNELNEFEIEGEVYGSKRIIEEKIGQKVTVFSYPHGRFDDRIIRGVKNAKYSFAISTLIGTNNYDDIVNMPFRLKKISPEPNEPDIYFKVKLNLNI